MNTALIATIFYFIYSYCLGAASVLAYRYSPSRWRLVPGLLVIVYYALALHYPHWAIQELRAGTPSPGDDIRFSMGCTVFAIALYLIAKTLKQPEVNNV